MKKKSSVPAQVEPLPTVEDLRHGYIDIANDPVATIRERLQALIAYEKLSGFNKPQEATDPATVDPLENIHG